MTTQVLRIAGIPLLAFALACLALPVVKRLARHYRIVGVPLVDSGHRELTPLLGGVAIIGVILATLAAARALPFWMLFGAVGLFAIGLVDDAIALRPLRKFIAQIAVVLGVVALGPRFGLAPWPLVSAGLAAFFLLSMVNAFNLIDGLDGLAAGVGVIAAAAISAIGLLRGDITLACDGIAIAGALGGFLLCNLHPASIFMGDCGALPLGLMLGALSLQAGGLAATNSRLSRYVVPILIMMAPLLDTAIVSVSRIATGNPVSRRGLDHSHHRLLALGLSYQRAVSVVWSVAALTAGCAVLLTVMPHAYVVATLPLIAAVFGLVGLFMIDLTFDSQPPGIAYGYMQGLARLILAFSYKRRVTEALLDLVLITAAYFGAWLIRLDFRVDNGLVMALLTSAPWVIGATYAAFLAVGVYRGMWRYAGFPDVIRFANGAVLAGILVVIISVITPIALSGSIAVLFVILLFNLLVGSRLSFRALRRGVALLALPADRVLIVGAGEMAEAAARYLTSGRNQNLRLVGFVDDDNFKLGKFVHGYEVLGSLLDLETIYSRDGFNQILVAADSLADQRTALVSAFANLHHLPIRRFSIRVNDMGVLALAEDEPVAAPGQVVA